MEAVSKNSEIEEAFKPIKLVATNVISRKGYFVCEVTGFKRKKAGDRPLFVVDFVVIKGRCKGLNCQLDSIMRR